VIRRITAIAASLCLTFVAFAAQADAPPGGEIVVVEEQVAVQQEQPVTLPGPAFVELQSKTIAAGIGTRWGKGTLSYEGEQHAFSMKGLSVGDLGVSSMVASGDIENLDSLSDFEGHYMALEAGAAAGVGASALTMRNENGVVITLRSELKGVQLTLGAQGFSIELE